MIFKQKFQVYFLFDPLRILCFVKKKRDNLHLILNTSAQHNVQITLGEMKYLREVKNSEKELAEVNNFQMNRGNLCLQPFCVTSKTVETSTGIKFYRQSCIVSIFETLRVYTTLYIVKLTPRGDLFCLC